MKYGRKERVHYKTSKIIICGTLDQQSSHKEEVAITKNTQWYTWYQNFCQRPPPPPLLLQEYGAATMHSSRKRYFAEEELSPSICERMM